MEQLLCEAQQKAMNIFFFLDEG